MPTKSVSGDFMLILQGLINNMDPIHNGHGDMGIQKVAYLEIIYYLYVYLLEKRVYSSVYHTVWKKDCTVQFTKCSKQLPSAWMYILIQ
jgi:hypothetical protein